MSRFPKSERGLRSKVARCRADLTREKRKYGEIHDGRGIRYVRFWIIFLLNDPNESKKYIRWYSKEFDGDIGEPVHKLCLALMLHRMGNTSEASYALADLMLANRHFIPTILGIPGPRRKRGRRSFDDASYVEAIPPEILDAISTAEKEWMSEKYKSAPFRSLRKRYEEIEIELDHTPVGAKRTRLVRESSGLLKARKSEITANKAMESDT